MSPASTDTSRSGGERGLSSTLGFALVIALVIAGSTAVLLLGSVSISSSQEGVQTERAEKMMTEFDSRSAMVALGDAESQSMEMVRGTNGRYYTDPDRGWMRVEVTNVTTGSKEVVMNTTLGSVIYENGDTVIAYQGGGVWRSNRENGSQMVSPPEFHYRGATLTLPAITVDGRASTGTNLKVTRNGSIQSVYPNASSDRANPLEGGRVEITVRSDYYHGWGTYFEERTDGDASVDPGNETASVELVIPTRRPNVRAGVVSGAVSTSLTIKNNAELDSYNSSNGDYDATVAGNSQVVAAGDVLLENNGVIDGDVEVGGDFGLGNNADLNGNLSYGNSFYDSDGGGNKLASFNGAWFAPNASVDAPDSIRSLIDEKRRVFSDPSNNDNASHSSTIDDIENGNCGGGCTLPTGTYYLEEMDLGGGELELDTTGGDIELIVDGDIDNGMSGTSGQLEVDGDGRVNIYAEGDLLVDEYGSGPSTSTAADNAFRVDDDNATRLWVYMNPTSTATIDNNAEFTGVIYGPGSDSSNGVDITVEQNAHVWGALVGNVKDLENQQQLHYDEALAQTRSVLTTSSLPSVTYLHISVNRINVTGG